MADKYKDIQEMRRYSQHFVTAAAAYSSLHNVPNLIERMQQVIDRFDALLARKQTSTSSWQTAQQAQRAVSAEAHKALDTLFADLDTARRKGISFNFAAFFPTGTRESIGKSVADRQASIARCLNALKDHPQVPDAAAWTTRLGDLQSRFASIADTATSGATGKRVDDQSFKDLRQSWKRIYLGCKRGMEAALLFEEREAELTSLFLDLQKGSSKTSSGAAESAATGQAADGAAVGAMAE